jgi:hypothetical protein
LAFADDGPAQWALQPPGKSHIPLRHAPAPEQFCKHVFGGSERSQESPVAESSAGEPSTKKHLHRPSAKQKPLPLQPLGHLSSKTMRSLSDGTNGWPSASGSQGAPQSGAPAGSERNGLYSTGCAAASCSIDAGLDTL